MTTQTATLPNDDEPPQEPDAFKLVYLLRLQEMRRAAKKQKRGDKWKQK